MEKKPVSNTTCSYRYKSCALGCGSNILENGGKEKAAIERHFREVDLDLIENVLTEKLTYGKKAANFKKVFTQQPLIISTFMKNVFTAEFVKQFIKRRFGLTSEEYNIRLFHSLRSMWRHYCLIKVTLLD